MEGSNKLVALVELACSNALKTSCKRLKIKPCACANLSALVLEHGSTQVLERYRNMKPGRIGRMPLTKKLIQSMTQAVEAHFTTCRYCNLLDRLNFFRSAMLSIVQKFGAGIYLFDKEFLVELLTLDESIDVDYLNR